MSEQPNTVSLNHRVQIIIPLFNAVEYTKQCVDTLKRNTHTNLYEVIFVDNGSTDGTKAFLKQLIQDDPEHFRVVTNDENKGFAGGVNAGLQAISSFNWEYACIANNDLLFTPNWLIQLLDCIQHAQLPNVGAVGPVASFAGGSQGVQATYKTVPEIDNWALTYHQIHNREWVEAGRIVGLCFLMNRKFFNEVGYLDERFVGGMWEDNDYCLRGKMKGFQYVVDRSTFLHHFGNKTFQENAATLNASDMFRGNKKRYWEKWAGKDSEFEKLATINATARGITDLDSIRLPDGRLKKWVVAACRCKDGAQYIERVLDRISEFADEIVVLVSKLTTDNTKEICQKFPKVVLLEDDNDDVVFNEAESRNRVLQMAYSRHPDWIWCLAGNTKIPLVDGTTKTIKELSEQSSWDKTLVYSVDKQNNIVPGKVTKVWKTGTRQTLKITLDNNEYLQCTPEHLVMLRDGTYVEAKDLKPNDSLMPLYRKYDNLHLLDYEMVYFPGENKWHFTHRAFALEKANNKTHLQHHKNFNHRDNSPDNLQLMTRQAHLELHARARTEEHQLKLDLAAKDPERNKINSEWQKAKFQAMTQEERIAYTEPWRQAALSPEANEKRKESLIVYWQTEEAELQKEGIRESVAEPSWKGNQHRGLLKWKAGLSPERRKEINENISRAKLQKNLERRLVLNHKVVSVEVAEIIDVYDMSVEVHHNFAIGFGDNSGTFVHNCFDHDEMPDHRIKDKLAMLTNPKNPEVMLWTFPIIQLWNGENLRRADGLWGRFWQGRMFRALPGLKIDTLKNNLIHCGSHPRFSVESLGMSMVKIIHYGNINAADRKRKYERYTKIDTDKDLNMILGMWKEYYWQLYYGQPTPQDRQAFNGTWRVLPDPKDWQRPPFGTFFDRDCYRHVHDELGMKLLPFTEHPTVSLCMLIHNEGNLLVGCLESVRHLVDEIICVDTGCTDNTPEIAEQLGAEVYEFKWNDNFSDARNYSLEKATGDWILRLDPDEVMPPEAAIRIPEMIRDPGVEAFIFPIMNWLEDPHSKQDANWALSETCRLFKNQYPTIKYEGLVHEELDNSFFRIREARKAEMLKQGLTEEQIAAKPLIDIRRSPVNLWHYGYLRGQQFLSTKFDYYCKLGIDAIKEDPNDARPYFTIAVHYLHIGDYPKAIENYHKVLELDPNHHMACNDVGVVYWTMGRLDKADEFFRRALKCMNGQVHEYHKSRVTQNLAKVQNTLLSMLLLP